MSACAFKSSARALGQVCARLACLLPSIRHCYYSMQRRTHVKQRRAECPVNVLQVYTRQSKTTSTITSKSFENFRRHFLKINFRYNVHFLTSTATYVHTQRHQVTLGPHVTITCLALRHWHNLSQQCYTTSKLTR